LWNERAVTWRFGEVADLGITEQGFSSATPAGFPGRLPERLRNRKQIAAKTLESVD